MDQRRQEGEEVIADVLIDAANRPAPMERKVVQSPRKLLKLYRELGLPRETPFGPDRDLNNASHELAHYWCASEDRRLLEFFGLGHPGDGRPTHVSFDDSCAEEELASLLGIMIERVFSGDWAYELHDHGWPDDSEKIRKACEELIRRGLCDSDGVPACVSHLLNRKGRK